MVASGHPKAIKGRWQLIEINFIEPEDAYQYDVVDNYGSDLDEEDDISLGEAGVITCVDAEEI